MPRTGIALGSNLGDRSANLREAVSRLRSIATPGESFLEASVYETEPELCPPGSPDFLNTVVGFSFDGTAEQLLEKTRNIEKSMGRAPSVERNAPRVIDLDILYFGNEVIASSHLVLPHPRIAERRFVLEPLAEIRPTLILPGQRKSVEELLAASGTPPLRPVRQHGG